MTPQEISDAIDELGLTQAQLAPLLGYGAPARVSEIANGKRAPSDAVTRLFRAYLDGYRPADWPA